MILPFEQKARTRPITPRQPGEPSVVIRDFVTLLGKLNTKSGGPKRIRRARRSSP